ncbi:MAG TPA: radical SAM protein [Polyangia bacterium]|nr:radical SAM protein [Polyangia bacterium]
MAVVHRPEKCVFEATLACNMSCRHCGSGAGRPRRDELGTGEVRSLFGQLAALGCRKLVISGGEPLLRPDWAGLVEAGARAGIRTGLFTNGILFDAQAARAARDAGAAAMGFSVDGIGDTHDRVRSRPGHFREIAAAMEAAATAGLPFSVVTHVNRVNIDELERIEGLLRDRGAFAWQLQPAIEMGNLRHNRDLAIRPGDMLRICSEAAALAVESELRVAVADTVGYYGPEEAILRSGCGIPGFRGCGAGVRVIGIESNGDVKGCLSIQPGHAGTDWVEGNVRNEPLAAIWNRPGAFAYNRQWTPERLGGFCRACEHAAACRGGCRSMMAAAGNGEENPFCAHRVISEQRDRSPGLAPVRAAAVLAAAAGLGLAACGENDPPDLLGQPDSEPDAGADAGTDVDADADADADGDADADTDADTDTFPDTETGDIVVYEFCMDTTGKTTIPVETRCGGPHCFRLKLKRLRHLAGDSWDRPPKIG